MLSILGPRICLSTAPLRQTYRRLVVLQRKACGFRDDYGVDGQIAAIARIHGAAVATRDVVDFEHCGVEIINPWTA